jgi:hypothetical protein
VLAAITGGWALSQYSTPERYSYLHAQLLRYTAACEAGWDVHVMLLTYEGWESAEHVVASSYYCSRVGASLEISVHLFPLEPLPAAAYGTLGTLAFQHRRLFAREAGRYDLFVSQEDDVALHAHHFSYYLHWSRVFSGTDLVPGLLFYELAPWLAAEGGALSSAHALLDGRIKDSYLLRHAGEPLLALWSSACCAYLATREQLAAAVARESWLGKLPRSRGEFNPYYGSARWMHLAHRLVLPVRDLARAMLHHAPNKYAKNAFDSLARNESLDFFYTGLSIAEAVAVLAPCNVGVEAVWRIRGGDTNVSVRVAGDACAACAEAVALKVVKDRRAVHEGQPVEATYLCVREQDVLFPPPEERLRL